MGQTKNQVEVKGDLLRLQQCEGFVNFIVTVATLDGLGFLLVECLDTEFQENVSIFLAEGQEFLSAGFKEEFEPALEEKLRFHAEGLDFLEDGQVMAGVHVEDGIQYVDFLDVHGMEQLEFLQDATARDGLGLDAFAAKLAEVATVGASTGGLPTDKGLVALDGM